MPWLLLLGIGVVALIATQKKAGSSPGFQMGIPPAGSVWTYTFEINKPLPEAAKQQILTTFQSYLPGNVEIVYPPTFSDSTHGTYTLRYPTQPEYPVFVGWTANLPYGYTLTVTSATQAPAY